jgi:outer membrane protein
MKKILSFVIVFALIASGSIMLAQDMEVKEMTLKDAIYLALEQNLDLKIQKAQKDTDLQTVKGSHAKYLPSLNLSYDFDSRLRPSNNVYDGVPNVEAKDKIYNVTVRQNTPFGGNFSVGFQTNRGESNSLSTRINPSMSSYIFFGIEQPLLKNFGLTASNYNIILAGNNFKISKLQMTEAIVNKIYDVESAYWELVHAHQSLQAAKLTLKRSQDLLKQNKIKQKVGTIAPIDVLSSEANVARNESSVIQAELRIQSNEETLKQILNLSKDNISIVPTDGPEIKRVDVNFDELLKEALENRTDLKRAKLDLKNQKVGVKYNKNQALPTLNLNFNFSSYGTGGTFWYNDLDLKPGDPGYRTKVSESTFSDSIRDMFKLINKNYSLGLTFSLPIGLKQERANLAKARISAKRSLLQLEKVENTIYSEVKGIVKEIESRRKVMEADKIAMELERKNLDAMEKKLAVGLTTNFEVLTNQQNYVQAQVSSLRSTIDYMLTLSRLNKILNRTFKVYNIKYQDNKK